MPIGPPIIEPFAFPKNLQEGGRAQVTCAVSSGDMPVTFSWKKDDKAIPLGLQVSHLDQIKFNACIFRSSKTNLRFSYYIFFFVTPVKIDYRQE